MLVLPPRTRDIVVSRFGLGNEARKRTLESIGQQYEITRERVRQIENFALQSIRKSEAYEKQKEAFQELKDLFVSLGVILPEEHFLNHVSKDPLTQNHVHFLLILGDDFDKEKEDDHFRHRWTVDEDISKKVLGALASLHNDLSRETLVSESQILALFSKRLVGVPDTYKREEVLKRWLGLSKVVDKNSLGEWGLSSSPNVHARGIRDYAYLVIRRHGSPLHFTEVAKSVSKLFERPAHVATCHNELIKDKERFALVGRGLYGLTEWGYSNGVVRDVIAKILEKEGSLSKEELIKKVLLERHVKENTVVVNLQNKKCFKRNDKGYYCLA